MEQTVSIDYKEQFRVYLLTERNVAKNTLESYCFDVEQLLSYFVQRDISVTYVTKPQLVDFLKYLKENGLTAKTLSRKISAIKLFFAFLHERYEIVNHAALLSSPKLEKRLPEYLSEEEVQTLLQASELDTSYKGIRNKVMLYLLYATGMRVTELMEISHDQIHFDTSFIHVVGKRNKERIIPLPQPLCTLLQYYLDTIYPKLLPKDVTP